MVAPVVVAAVAGGVLLAGAGAVIARPIKNLAGYSLAILGQPDVGKSTLLAELRQRAPADSTGKPTGKFWIGSGRKRLKLDVVEDLAGHGGGLALPQWKSAFLRADYVWYLFRADLVAQRDPAELDRLKSQLGLLDHWRKSQKRGKPKVLLVGTWAEARLGFEHDPKALARAIGAAPVIALAASKLGNAPVVVGSLATSDDARALIEDIGAA